MSRRYLIVGAVLICTVVVYVLLGKRSHKSPSDALQPAPARSHAAANDSPPANASPPATSTEIGAAAAQAQQQARYDRETEAMVADLARLEAQRRRKTDSEVATRQIRESLQRDKATAWNTLLSTNLPAYYALRAKAANSLSKTAACTLCDHHGSLNFCILCQHSGLCVSCGGSGKSALNQACPTCRGSGKCFLCLGSGRMACPFCDDGIIYPNLPQPATQMPLQVAGLSRPPSSPEDVAKYQAAKAAQSATPAGNQPEPDEALPASTRQFGAFKQLLIGIVFLVGLAAALPRVAPVLGQYLNREPDSAEGPFGSIGGALEEGVSDFVTTMRTALSGSSGKRPLDGVEPSNEDNLERFYLIIPERLNAIRQLFSVLSRPLEDDSRQRLLMDLSLEIRGLRSISELPQLRPIWQVATALEALLRQLGQKLSLVTPSNMRTIASAIVLLEMLCSRDAKPEALLHPAPRFLAVDDDAVTRQAVSMSLKHVFDPPDLAPDAPTALELAARNAYDVVFLDIEMPDLDGFDVCSRIHASEPNAATPVIFVTNHTDFESRAKATFNGGCDFIAKPFLTFEVILKALTLTLDSRLQEAAKLQAAQLAAL